MFWFLVAVLSATCWPLAVLVLIIACIFDINIDTRQHSLRKENSNGMEQDSRRH